MKIRSGFVSNSSSSSFLIYGVSFDKVELKEILHPDGSDLEDAYEELEERIPKGSGIDIHCMWDWDTYYVGASWDTVGDDETGRQFKDRVEKVLTEVLGNGLSFATHEEAWRDG